MRAHIIVICFHLYLFLYSLCIVMSIPFIFVSSFVSSPLDNFVSFHYIWFHLISFRFSLYSVFFSHFYFCLTDISFALILTVFLLSLLFFYFTRRITSACLLLCHLFWHFLQRDIFFCGFFNFCVFYSIYLDNPHNPLRSYFIENGKGFNILSIFCVCLFFFCLPFVY